MNSRLKEYSDPSVYRASVVKRKKPQADCVLPHTTRQSENKLIGLGGSRYEEIAGLVTRGAETTLFQESIDDGRIDFDRIADRMSRKQGSCKLSESYAIVLNAFDNHESIRPAKAPEARIVIFSVIGTLVEITNEQFIIDWYGGGKLAIPFLQAEGDWTELKIGDWLQATVARKTNGEVVRAMLLGPAEEPQSFSDEELRESYALIPPADLPPVK